MSQTARMPWALLAALWVAEMTSSFESAMILAALKVLVVQFGDAAAVGWLVTAFLIVGAAVSAVVGRLGDIYGRQRVLMAVLVIGMAGSLLSAASSSYGLVLAGRVMQGATTAILPLVIGLVRENLPPERVPAGIGLMISGASIGTAAGLILGGVIVDFASWHGIFLASASFCLVSLLLVRSFVPPSRRAVLSQPVDWWSGILFAPGVTLVLLYLAGGKAWGFGSPAALALLVALLPRKPQAGGQQAAGAERDRHGIGRAVLRGGHQAADKEGQTKLQRTDQGGAAAGVLAAGGHRHCGGIGADEAQ